jgi:hypothetical protein
MQGFLAVAIDPPPARLDALNQAVAATPSSIIQFGMASAERWASITEATGIADLQLCFVVLKGSLLTCFSNQAAFQSGGRCDRAFTVTGADEWAATGEAGGCGLVVQAEADAHPVGGTVLDRTLQLLQQEEQGNLGGPHGEFSAGPGTPIRLYALAGTATEAAAWRSGLNHLRSAGAAAAAPNAGGGIPSAEAAKGVAAMPVPAPPAGDAAVRSALENQRQCKQHAPAPAPAPTPAPAPLQADSAGCAALAMALRSGLVCCRGMLLSAGVCTAWAAAAEAPDVDAVWQAATMRCAQWYARECDSAAWEEWEMTTGEWAEGWLDCDRERGPTGGARTFEDHSGLQCARRLGRSEPQAALPWKTRSVVATLSAVGGGAGVGV